MRILIFILILVSFSCTSNKSNKLKLPSGVDYKYEMLGDGILPKKGEVVSVNLSLTSMKGDTIHYVPGYPYFFKIGDSPIDSIFMAMKPDDSITFTLDRALINEYFQFHSLKETKTGKANIHVKLNASYEETLAKEMENKLLSKREIEEQAELLNYLKNEGTEYESIGGIFRKITKENAYGTPIAFGDEVVIQYKGRFLNGYVFDDTSNKLRTPSFIYGREQQLIDGIHYGLNGMKEGESVKIILPSRRAFGEGGSVAGIVPPYTTVIFEIEIVKVIKT